MRCGRVPVALYMCVYLLFVIPHIVFGFGLQGGQLVLESLRLKTFLC